jgi:hypothetical protein
VDKVVPFKIDWIYLAYKMGRFIWWPFEINSQQNDFIKSTRFESICDVMKCTDYFVSLQTSVVVTEDYNVMVSSEELIGTTAFLTL